MTEATFTFRVDDELKIAFTEAAKAHDVTGAQLLRGFMRDYLKHQREKEEYDSWFRQQVQLGIDAANSGKLVTSEDIETEFATRRAETRRKLNSSTS